MLSTEIQRADCIFTEKKSAFNGPTQFKPVLLKDQLLVAVTGGMP